MSPADDFVKIVAACPAFFVSAWLLMIFAGIAGAEIGIRPFGYLTSMVDRPHRQAREGLTARGVLVIEDEIRMAQLLKRAGALAVANGSLVKGGPDVTGIREMPFGWVMAGLAGQVGSRGRRMEMAGGHGGIRGVVSCRKAAASSPGTRAFTWSGG